MKGRSTAIGSFGEILKRYWASPSHQSIKRMNLEKDIELEGIIRGERGASAPSEREGGRSRLGSMEGREKQRGREKQGGSGTVAHPDCHPACNRPINSS